MNILHINQSDLVGGAAIASYRLHNALIEAGVQSTLLVGKKHSNSHLVDTVYRRTLIEKILRKGLFKPLGLNYIDLIASFDIPQHLFYQQASVLNFHNLHTGYFNYLAVSALTRHKPAVFTLHDMWSFTGHCAYSLDCDRWKYGCGKCPHPNIYPEIRMDNTRVEWKLKQWIYQHADLTIVTPSTWLTDLVKQSMLKHLPLHHIPNGIDIHLYQPLDRSNCRLQLGIPDNKKVLMFGAEILTDARKGSDLLHQALQRLPDSLKRDTVLLTLGKGSETLAEAVGIATVNLGYVSDEQRKAVAYSAADLFVFPTRNDNLPLMLQESMACGTPMVSFRVGGVPDLVRPGITGYLAQPEDVNDMTDGIVQLLEDDQLRKTMSSYCREIAVEEYSLALQVSRYMQLYEKLAQ